MIYRWHGSSIQERHRRFKEWCAAGVIHQGLLQAPQVLRPQKRHPVEVVVARQRHGEGAQRWRPHGPQPDRPREEWRQTPHSDRRKGRSAGRRNHWRQPPRQVARGPDARRRGPPRARVALAVPSTSVSTKDTTTRTPRPPSAPAGSRLTSGASASSRSWAASRESLADGSWSGPTHGTTASAGCSCAGNESAPTTTVFFTLPARSSRSARPADIFGTGSKRARKLDPKTSA